MSKSRRSGILAHPTSFPSPHGIGDLGIGAYDFIDFMKAAGQTLWQILPLNPTSFGDSPYQSFSAFAGNPLLISPDLLVKDGLLHEHDFWRCGLGGIRDNPRKVDYGDVIQYKDKLFRIAYNNYKSAEQKPCFKRFNKKNAAWLDDFCLFTAVKEHYIEQRRNDTDSPEYRAFKASAKKYLTENQIDDYYYGATWQTWQSDIAHREKPAVKRWSDELADEIEYLGFLQYLFFKQWDELKEYANAAGVMIIGDVPIFVALDSADTWVNPQMYCLGEDGFPGSVAGVPPDYFSETGQLWGNPLYNWERHKDDNYQWWISRIQSALTVSDIIRIDHFRGFESYWSVPFGEKTAVKGKWLKGPGKALFAAVKELLGDLPVIAEDLGMITPAVERLRDSLGLPGMRIMQFGFDGSHKNPHCPHNYTPNTVAYTGTHDNETTRGWYESNSAEIKDRFRRYLNAPGDDSSWDLIRAVMLCCADYAVVPIQDVLSLNNDARMNFPGKTGGNWQFRYTCGALTPEHAERLKYLSVLSDRNHCPECEAPQQDMQE